MKMLSEVFAPVVVVFALTLSNHFGTQETNDERIIIVNQDGQKVDVNGLKVRARNTGNSDVDIQVGDGKIVIVDKDGETREIDLSGAQNIIVNKSVQSIIQNGEEKKQITGKAIIVGPDGERQIIELGDGVEGLADFEAKIGQGIFEFLPEFKGGNDRLPGNFVFGPTGSIGKYMIGVSCTPVSDEMRSQLELADGVGLVVSSASGEDSPAADAGIERHDILMFADQEELSSITDLVNAVQAAGKEDREMSLTLLRRGNEIGINVTPVERKGVKSRMKAFFPGSGEFDFRFEKVGPGIVIDAEKSFPDDLLRRMQEIDESMKERMEEMTQLQEEFRRSLPDFQNNNDDDRDN